jgi:hypothetical protein
MFIILSRSVVGVLANDDWNQLVDRGDAFGDYNEAEFERSWITASRALVSDSTGANDTRHGARALWVGVNLEYQGMLTSTDPIWRADHALHARDYVLCLRELLRTHRISEFESNDPTNISHWQRALLSLPVIEQELGAELGEPTLSATIAARIAVIEEFDPTNVSPDGNGPNSYLMREVGTAFARARTSALQAIAARVQASLTLGAAYGYLPNAQRESAKESLGDDEKAIYPDRSDEWKCVEELIEVTFNGKSDTGIVGAYANVKREIKARSGKAGTLTTAFDLAKRAYEIEDRLTELRAEYKKASAAISSRLRFIDNDNARASHFNLDLTPKTIVTDASILSELLNALRNRREKRSLASFSIEQLKTERLSLYEQSDLSLRTSYEVLSKKNHDALVTLAMPFLAAKPPIGATVTSDGMLARKIATTWVDQRIDDWLDEQLETMGMPIPAKDASK